MRAVGHGGSFVESDSVRTAKHLHHPKESPFGIRFQPPIRELHGAAYQLPGFCFGEPV